MFNPLSPFDSKENRPTLDQLRDIVLAEHFQEVDWSAYLVENLPEPIPYQHPQSAPQAEVVPLKPNNAANVAITGNTKTFHEDLALRQVYEIHDDMERKAA